MSTEASYYVKAVDANTISLFNTSDDAIAGINTISLTSFGNGEHQFRSSTKKNFVTSIVVKNSERIIQIEEENSLLLVSIHLQTPLQLKIMDIKTKNV